MLEYAILVSSNRFLEARDNNNSVAECIVVLVDEVKLVEFFNIVECGFTHERSEFRRNEFGSLTPGINGVGLPV